MQLFKKQLCYNTMHFLKNFRTNKRTVFKVENGNPIVGYYLFYFAVFTVALILITNVAFTVALLASDPHNYYIIVAVHLFVQYNYCYIAPLFIELFQTYVTCSKRISPTHTQFRLDYFYWKKLARVIHGATPRRS